MATQPDEILNEVAPDDIPLSQPPGDSNYRPADLAGVSCASCVKFNYTGVVEEGDGMIPTGTCDLYEAQVRGDYVSDGYGESSPPLDGDGQPDWNFSDSETAFAEVHLASAEVAVKKDGKVVKEIMRTGQWPVIPTAQGNVSHPLTIVKSGMSDPGKGVMAMEELVANFKAGAIPNVQVPLSDDEHDHKNNTRVNTGFVRDVWIQESEEDDEDARLVAEIDFTEPEIREKVLRGTYADVSCGLPWSIRSRGKDYGACLEHVAITNKPFMDGLGPFVALSDERHEAADVVHFGALADAMVTDTEVANPEPAIEDGDPPARTEEPPQAVISYERQRQLITEALADLSLPLNDYEVTDIAGNQVTVTHLHSGTSWDIPFEIDGENVSLPKIADWMTREEESAAGEETPPAPDAQMSAIEYHQRLRTIRAQGPETKAKEATMALTREELDNLELSDTQRTAFQSLLDERAELTASVREKDTNHRIDELKGLGLEERPGALKLYRQVMLADDGGPAAVLLSDTGEKESLTALQILDRFIDAIKGSDELVELSDQHLVNNNDPKPPDNADNEVPFEERLAASKAALGMSS